VGIEGVAEPNERTLTRQVRAAELTGILDSLDPAQSPSDNELDVLATLIFDAGVDADEVSLRLALDRLRDDYWRRSADPADPAPSDATRAGALLGFLKVARWALDRAPAIAAPPLPPDSNPARLLQAIAENPGTSNKNLGELLGLREDEVSRSGRKLMDQGFAIKRRIGQENYWVITPRGRELLVTIGPPEPLDDGMKLPASDHVVVQFSKLTARITDEEMARQFKASVSYVRRLRTDPAGVALRSLEKVLCAIGHRLEAHILASDESRNPPAVTQDFRKVSPPSPEEREKLDKATAEKHQERGSKVLRP